MYTLRITFETIADPTYSRNSSFNELYYSGKDLEDLYKAMRNYVVGDPKFIGGFDVPPELEKPLIQSQRQLQHYLDMLFDAYQMHLYETTKDRSLIEYTLADEKQLWKFRSSLNPFRAKSRYKF